jgi:hypothetical protein
LEAWPSWPCNFYYSTAIYAQKPQRGVEFPNDSAAFFRASSWLPVNQGKCRRVKKRLALRAWLYALSPG